MPDLPEYLLYMAPIQNAALIMCLGILSYNNDVLNLPGILTTDGNAASGGTSIHQGTAALDLVDWHIVSTRDCYSTEYKRKKCAEVLVPDSIRPHLIDSICVYLPAIQTRLAAEIRLLSKKLKMKDPTPDIVWTPVYFY